VSFILRETDINQIALLYYIPPLRTRFLSYGVRDATITRDGKDGPRSSKEDKDSYTTLEKLLSLPFTPFLPLLDLLQRIRVPHAWFKHFYVLAAMLSLFWLQQILTQGTAFQWLAERSARRNHGTVYGLFESTRVYYVWALFLAHSCRRLYESFTFDKKSASTMWVGHWFMGLLHYFAVTIAIWIEAGPLLLSQRGFALEVPDITTLAIQIVPATGFFILLNMSQHRIHRYLFQLPSKPKVIVPSKGIFRYAISPHYGSEVGIYTCLFWLSSLSFETPNWTMLCVLVFVATNLGVSAQVARERYAKDFHGEVVRNKSLFGLPGLCNPDLEPLWHIDTKKGKQS
jgi:3-oxo-5-alpha-steroid 4-dehydrogenase 3